MHSACCRSRGDGGARREVLVRVGRGGVCARGCGKGSRTQRALVSSAKGGDVGQEVEQWGRLDFRLEEDAAGCEKNESGIVRVYSLDAKCGLPLAPEAAASDLRDCALGRLEAKDLVVDHLEVLCPRKEPLACVCAAVGHGEAAIRPSIVVGERVLEAR